MDRLRQIKAKIERAKTYGMEPSVTLADIEWLISELEMAQEDLSEYCFPGSGGDDHNPNHCTDVDCHRHTDY